VPRRNRQLVQRGLLIIYVSGVRWIYGLYRVIMSLNIRGWGKIDQGLRGGVRFARGIEWMARRSLLEGKRGPGLSSGV